MNSPVYHLTGVKKFYNSRPAVDIEFLSIPQASITGLVGPNGSGKSTLLNMLAFTDRPSEGTILFNGRKAELFDEAVRFRVSLLAQEPYLLKRSVYDNIAYGLKLRGGNPSRYTEQVKEALALVGLPSKEFSDRPWYQLSGGEAQRVALAARLVLKPEVLILDEPTASVDAESARRIMDCALMASSQWGATLIIASHDWIWLHEICGNVLQMFNGKISGSGIENNITLSLESPSPKRGEHAVKGIIIHLSLGPAANTVMVSVRAGSRTFTLRISHEEALKKAFFPGQTVYITYPLSADTRY